jgi:ubiquitin-activating enzyme E1 C
MTQGVVKNIIPAIASTNAIIAASCVSEALKIATNTAPYLQNYMMMIGTEGVYSFTFELEKKEECPVCGGETVELSISRDMTVEELIEYLQEKQNMWVFSFRCHALCL